MANLKTALMKGTGSGNVLGKTSTEELQKLSTKLGQPVPPTNPAAAQQIGATPQQAAMTGSSANLKSSLQIAASGGAAPASLRDTLRQEQSRTELTSAEKTQQEMQKKLESGGAQFTAEKAGKGVQSSLTLSAEQMDPSQISLELKDKFEWLNDEAVPEPQRLSLAKFLKGDASTQTLMDLASITGPDGQQLVQFGDSEAESLRKIKDMLGDTTEQIGLGTSEAAIDYADFGVDDFYINEDGTVDEDAIAELSEALGIPAEEIKTMNMSDIQSQMDAVVADEYSKTQNLTDQASDINLSAAERAEARKMAKDMGATGIASAELTDVDQLADTVAEADTIQIGDQTMTVEEALDNDRISQIVHGYLSGDKQAEKELLAMGNLKDFVDTHKGAFEALASSIDSGTKAFFDINAHNKNEAAELEALMGKAAETFFEANAWTKTWSADKKDIPVLDAPSVAGILPVINDDNIKMELAMADAPTIAHIKRLSEYAGGQHRANFIDSVNFRKTLEAAMAAGESPEDTLRLMGHVSPEKLQELKGINKLVEAGIFPIPESSDKLRRVLLGGGDWRDAAISQSANNLSDFGERDFNTSTIVNGITDMATQANDVQKLLTGPGLFEDGRITTKGASAALSNSPELADRMATEYGNRLEPGAFEYMKKELKNSIQGELNQAGPYVTDPNYLNPAVNYSGNVAEMKKRIGGAQGAIDILLDKYNKMTDGVVRKTIIQEEIDRIRKNLENYKSTVGSRQAGESNDALNVKMGT